MKIKCLTLIIYTIVFASCLTAQKIVVKENNGKIFLWMESEAGNINAPMMVHETEGASGGQYIEVRSGNNNIINAPEDGQAIYKFTLEYAGTYKIWGRVKVDMDDEDAFWLKMDDDKWVIWQDIEVGCKWHWDEVHDYRNNKKVMTYNLDAGSHTLVITYGMDQTRLDKLFITNDLEYVPIGRGPGAEAVFSKNPKLPIVNQSLHFDGSKSTSTEGSIVAFNWDFGDGQKATTIETNHTYSAPGEYQVKLIVEDDTGLTGRLTKSVNVYTTQPIARITYSPDRSEKNEIVTLDGSGSFDPNGEIVQYRWDFGDGSSGDGAVVEHQYASAGEYSAILTVTDSEGITVSKTRLVTVISGVPKKIIYETDMCLDVDDVGALAMLHGLANNSEAEILAVCFNEVHPGGATAIDAINTWYGRGDIPVGVYKKPLADPDPSVYLDELKKFPHDLDSESAPSALEVYKEVLSKQPDKSVTIISVGFINNLYDVLIAEPELVEQKVKELVVMGGIHGGGFNLARHNTLSQSEYIFRNWPTPLVFSQPGTGIFTGEGLENSPEENPVREAYYQFFYSSFCARHSWDQIAVLYGVRGLSDYFTDLENVDKWKMEPGYRTYFKTRLPNESYARVIEDLMLVPPVE